MLGELTQVCDTGRSVFSGMDRAFGATRRPQLSHRDWVLCSHQGCLFFLLASTLFSCLSFLSHSLLHEMVAQAIALESNERKLTLSPRCDLGQAPILCEALFFLWKVGSLFRQSVSRTPPPSTFWSSQVHCPAKAMTYW